MPTVHSQAGDDHGSHDDFITCTIKVLPKEQWTAAAATAVRINPGNQVDTHLFRAATGTVLPLSLIHI